MSAVTVQEIVEALRIPPSTMFFELMRVELINRIEAHGIAPPDGMVLVQSPCSYPLCQATQGCVGQCNSPVLTAVPEVKP